MKKKLVVLTGAGISAESGIKTFRDANGLWEGHDVMEVASPEGFRKNPALVLEFYNQRRRQLLEVSPNAAHHFLAELEADWNISIITQNVDDLHERAGSSHVLHLHGQLLQARSSKSDSHIQPCKTDIHLGDLAQDGSQLRPNIVWFGESVPAMDKAIQITEKADIFLVIGTSLQVYPAAGLLSYAPDWATIIYVDPNPAPISTALSRTKIIASSAVQSIETLKNLLKNSK
jgi:NAD-dependent deacetylase